MDRLVTLEPSNLIVIRVEQGPKCFGELTLRNVMHTMPVAFQLQPINMPCYSIHPKSGIVPPLSTVTLEISYDLPLSSLLPNSFPHSQDSFILHSIVVPGAVVKDPSSTFDSVPNDWFSTKKRQVFSDSSIGVLFVGSVILAQLVTNGLVEDVREVLKMSNPAWRAVDSVDAHGQTLLHLAITKGRTDLVELLLQFKPNVEARNQSGQNPLEAAAAAGELSIVKLLLACQASTGRSLSSKWGSLHLAVRGGHTEVAKLLLLNGAETDILTGDGSTALHLAVQERNKDCARLLLENGANPDHACTTSGETALHIAASLGDEHMVKLLLQEGANKDILDQLGSTAYDIAAQNGHIHLYNILRLGDSLCAAARRGEARTIHWLLQNGALVNVVDQHGWTALHRASFKGQTNTVRALIEKGVDIDARDKDGYTALHCATESGQAEVIEMLVKKGVNIEVQTNKGVTALQIADSLCYPGISRILKQDRDVHSAVPIPSAKSTGKAAKYPVTEDIKKKPNRRRIHQSSFSQHVPLAVI